MNLGASALVIVAFVSDGAIAAASNQCVPDPGARAALRSWDDASDRLTIAERQKLLEGIAAKYSADYEIQARKISFYRGALPEAWPRLRDFYVKRAEQYPNDSLALMLAAEALRGSDTHRTVELLTKVRQMPAALPVSALKLAEIYQTGRFEDKEKAQANFAAYAGVCAEYILLSAGRVLSRLEDSQAQAGAIAKRLRSRLDAEDSPDPGEYELLWSLEFRSRPPTGHAEVRRQVTKDLARLLALNPDRRSYGTLLAGMRQSSASAEDIEIFEDRVLKEAPTSSAAYRITNDRWRKAHKEPTAHEDTAAWAAWRKEYRAALKQWAMQFTDVAALEESYTAALIEDDELDDKQAIAAVQKSLRQKILRNTASLAMYAHAARLLLDKGAPVKAYEFMREAWLRAEAKDGANLEDDTLTGEQRNELAAGPGLRGLIAPEYLKATVLAGKKNVPASLRTYVNGPMPTSTADRVSRYRALAWLASLDAREPDALTFFQQALFIHGKAGFVRGKLDDALLAEAKSAFLKAGGTENVSSLWLGAPHGGSEIADGRWVAPKKTLPAFEILDISGKPWKLAQFEGKVVLINVWATWCGPCRAELPLFQALYEKTKERQDIQVISFNVDEAVGQVEPYVKERGYTFPILIAHEFVRGLLDDRSGIPQNWLIDQEGKWIATQLGFDEKDRHWVDSMLRKLEAARTKRAANAR